MARIFHNKVVPALAFALVSTAIVYLGSTYAKAFLQHHFHLWVPGSPILKTAKTPVKLQVYPHEPSVFSPYDDCVEHGSIMDADFDDLMDKEEEETTVADSHVENPAPPRVRTAQEMYDDLLVASPWLDPNMGGENGRSLSTAFGCHFGNTDTCSDRSRLPRTMGRAWIGKFEQSDETASTSE